VGGVDAKVSLNTPFGFSIITLYLKEGSHEISIYLSSNKTYQGAASEPLVSPNWTLWVFDKKGRGLSKGGEVFLPAGFFGLENRR